MITTNYGANPPTIMEVIDFIQIVDHKKALLTTSPFGKNGPIVLILFMDY